MKLKEQVLLILMSSKGKFVSGEEISKQLYVSRNAVWKAINSLRADGFIIDAAQNKGYLLSGGETDDFTRYGILRIRQLLKKSADDADITIKDIVTSTNTLLRISAENGAPSKTVLIANEQTEGRGRHGKSFYSPVCASPPRFQSRQSVLHNRRCGCIGCKSHQKGMRNRSRYQVDKRYNAERQKNLRYPH